jgi:hypothetical protein
MIPSETRFPPIRGSGYETSRELDRALFVVARPRFGIGYIYAKLPLSLLLLLM